jgi:hypothetical protein
MNKANSGFSIKLLKSYHWPVDVKVPVMNADGEGEFDTHRFTGHFKHLSNAEANALLAKAQEKIDQFKAESETSDVSALRTSEVIANHQIELYADIWLGWGEDLTGEDGQPLSYSEEVKLQLLGQKMIREAVMKAHQESQGGEEARLKNSATLPVVGQAGGEN